MSLYFLFNNLHFAFEILGALAFLIVSWLAFDAFLLRRDFLTASRGVGFLSLAAWQVLHALSSGAEVGEYIGYAFYLLGLGLVFTNLVLEKPVSRPEFHAVLILPAFAGLFPYLNSLSALLYTAITFLAWRQYKAEQKKHLKPFWFGFLCLALGAFVSIFYEPDSFGTLWAFGHILEFIGFGGLFVWVWQYLQLRIREELILIFVSVALFISIVVTLAFSLILINQIEAATRANLLTNAKVLDLAISRFKEEALAKARFLAARADIKDALVRNKFLELESLTKESLEDEKLGFLTILNKEGEVILRAHALTQREDNLSRESAVRSALAGKEIVTIESSPAEEFSIRAAAPIFSQGKIAGVIIAGFLLDNALVDNIKRITGLEMSIYEMDIVVATTLLNPDGRTRSTGSKVVDLQVKENVLTQGQEITLRTEILSRPALASYLPLKNSEEKIIGMISSLKPQQEILALANAVNRLTLVTVAVLMLLSVLPIYLFTRRLSLEVT